MNKKAKQGRKPRKRVSFASATRFVPPRTVETFFAMPMHFQEVYASVTQAISRMRNDRVSLSRAAQEFGVDRRHIQRYGGRALRKGRNGRYRAKKHDGLRRVLLILTRHGVVEIGITDSDQASVLGEYWKA